MVDDYAPAISPEEEEAERRRRADDYPAPAPPASPASVIPDYAKAPNVAPDMSLAVQPPNIGDMKALTAAPAVPPPVQPPAQARLRALTDQGPPPVKPLHGFMKGLDIFGKIVRPDIEQRLRYAPQNEYERNLKAAQGDVAAAAAPETEQAKLEEMKANTRLAKAKAEEAESTKEEWSTVPGVIGPNGEPIQQEKRSGQMRYGPVTGAPLKPPTTTQEQNKLVFQGVIGKLDAAGLPTGPKEIDKSLDAALANRTITADEHSKAKSYQAANPTPGTNLQVTVAGAQQKQGFEHTEKATAETYKRYETAQDAEQRLSRMEASYQKALKGDQQAMLALLTDHIGMTLGLQKGARITKDILNEATASMPWLEKIESKFDGRGYLSGITLGPEQMAQMLDLGYEARDRAVQGAHDSSELYGVQPPPGAETVFGKRKPGEKPALQKEFAVPAGAPAAPKEDGHKLKADGHVIAVSKGGKWVAP